MDKDFEEKCLNKREIIRPPATRKIEDSREMRILAEKHCHNTEYFLESAMNLLSSTTPLAALILAYFAMEHKANQLLALHGYKVESHICTQIGLSRIGQRKDLAQQLSEIFTLRQNIGYRMNLIPNPENLREAEDTINKIVVPFLKEIDRMIVDLDSDK